MVEPTRAVRRQDAALVLAVLATVAFLPAALSPWPLPKLLVLGVAGILCWMTRPAGRLPHWFLVVTGSAAAVMTLAALVGPTPLAQLLGRWPRFEGVVAIGGYALAAALGARALGPEADDRRRSAFHVVLALVSIAVGAVALTESVGIRILPGAEIEATSRPGSLLGNATDQGILGAMITVLLATAVVGRTSATAGPATRVLWSVGVLAGATSVILSASRAALLALLAGMLLLGVLWIAEARRRAGTRRILARRMLVVSGSLLAAIGAALLVPLTQSRVLGTSPFAAATVEGRLMLWTETLRVLGERPLLGTGPSGLVDALPAQHGPEWFPLFGYGSVTDSPHDIVLQAAVAGGPLLVVLAVVLLVGVVVAAVRRIRELTATAEEARRAESIAGALAAVVVWVLAASTHFTTAGPMILVGLCIGSIVARSPTPPPAGPSTGRPVLRQVRHLSAAVVVAWTVLVGLVLASEISLRAGVEAVTSGDVALADSAFRAAQAWRPWDPGVPIIAAEEFVRAADGGTVAAAPPALEWAGRAASAAPSSVAATLALAAAQQHAGRLADAESTLRGLDDRAPHDPQTLHRLGAVLLLEARYDDAEHALLEAHELAPGESGIVETLAYLYQLTGDEAALAALRSDLAAPSGAPPTPFPLPY